MKRNSHKGSREGSSDVFIPGLEEYVTFTGLCKWEDQGIGPYEFWGFPGNQVDWQWVCEDFTWDKTQWTAEQNQIIDNFDANVICREIEENTDSDLSDE